MAIHPTTIEMIHSVPAEVEAGTDITLKVKVSCPGACDLRGIPIKVLAGDEVVIVSELSACGETINATEDLALKTPQQVGEHAWRVVFPRHESEAVVHEESCVVLFFKTTPHTTSMAVWDIPSPLVINRPFRVKVGVKCSAMCELVGQVVEIRDESGARMGQGRLDGTPWPGTAALYVAELDLVGPAAEGTSFWTASFADRELALPHSEASADFSFRTAMPPEHKVTVTVTDKDTDAPLEQVDVGLGSYRASTNSQGLAILELPTGMYELNAWKAGYDAPPRTLEVGADLVVHVEAAFVPARNPDDEQVWM